MNNITSYNELLKLIDEKPMKKVLMHSCCAPCSSTCLNVLKKGFIVDIYYSNSNINSLEEFEKRANEQIRLNKEINNGKVIMDEYKPNDFHNAIKGLEHLGERSERCYHCYELRMRRTCEYAKEHGYDYFTTTLSLSPHKNSDWVNEIGMNLSLEYQIPFLYSNFKKQNGYQKSIEFSKQYDLYRQDYCGCIYSKIERDQRKEGKLNE